MRTCGFYESLPAPAFCLQRVLEDYRYTRDEDDNMWDIPSAKPQGAVVEPLPVPAEEVRKQESEDEDENEEEADNKALPLRS